MMLFSWNCFENNFNSKENFIFKTYLMQALCSRKAFSLIHFVQVYAI